MDPSFNIAFNIPNVLGPKISQHIRDKIDECLLPGDIVAFDVSKLGTKRMVVKFMMTRGDLNTARGRIFQTLKDSGLKPRIIED